MIKIAAVQIDYLLAYQDRQRRCDYLAVPLHVRSFDPGNVEAARALREWRLLLRETYERGHRSKLLQIVRHCAHLGADVIAFPEYSVPAASLPSLQEASSAMGVTIIAGSHFVDLDDPSTVTAYRHLGGERLLEQRVLDGHAVCPILVRGRLDYVQKITESKYDKGVGLPNDATARRGPVEIPLADGELLAEVFVCSDYLEGNRQTVDRMTRIHDFKPCDATFVVSCTPSIGPFASRAKAAVLSRLPRQSQSAAPRTDDSDDQSAVRQAYAARGGRVVVFTNNAGKGGTKAFYDASEPDYLTMEENDGSLGVYRTDGAVVKSGGMPQDAEGIVFVEAFGPQRRDPNTAHQYAVSPIIHSSGPDDPFAVKWHAWMGEYRAAPDLRAKKALVSQLETELDELSLLAKNDIFAQKLAFLVGNCDQYRDEEKLDAMIGSACMISGEAPHVDTWLRRACIASCERLAEIRSRIPRQKRSDFDELAEDCSRMASELEKSVHIPGDEIDLRGELVRLRPEELLTTSGTFYSLVTGEHSSVRACINAARWVQFLAEMGNPDDALGLIERVLRLRPYPAVRVLRPIEELLRQNRDRQATTRLGCFIAEHESCERSLQGVARRSFGVRTDESIVVYGYSEAVLHVLAGLTCESRRAMGRVIVAEVRNRHNTGEGLRNAETIARMGFRTALVTDASLPRVLSQDQLRVTKLLMGFKMASSEGLVNTVGSLAAAEAAQRWDAEVVFAGYSLDLWPEEIWTAERHRILTETKSGVWLELAGRKRLDGSGVAYAEFDFASDLVPWHLADWVITDLGMEDAAAVKARIEEP